MLESLKVIFFVLVMYLPTISQTDCIMTPLNDHLNSTDYIFIFKVDRLIHDTLSADLARITGKARATTAIGDVLKIYQDTSSELFINQEVEVNWPDTYIFENKATYLLFCDYFVNGEFKVRICSYSEKLSKKRKIRSLLKKVERHQYSP